MKRKDSHGLSRGKAHYLYWEHRVGAEYLVKDKDGTCYLVDHGTAGITKEKDHWIDIGGPDWQANSFEEAKYDFDIVSWSDEKPLKIYDYLRINGWWDEFYEG